MDFRLFLQSCIPLRTGRPHIFLLTFPAPAVIPVFQCLLPSLFFSPPPPPPPPISAPHTFGLILSPPPHRLLVILGLLAFLIFTAVVVGLRPLPFYQLPASNFLKVFLDDLVSSSRSRRRAVLSSQALSCGLFLTFESPFAFSTLCYLSEPSSVSPI